MTNKRQIKKYINRVSQDIAGLILPAAVYTKAMTESEAEDALLKLTQLMSEATGRLSIAYDKAPGSFADPKAYRAAKTKYYREAYSKAVKDFEDGVEAILAPINKAKS